MENKTTTTVTEIARDAAFTMAVLYSSGLAAPVIPRNDTAALHFLTLAAAAGDLGAQAALADRAFTGRGVSWSCMEGTRRALAVAARLSRQAERAGDVTIPPASVRLKDRWLNASYVHQSKVRPGAFLERK